jgi:predicted regulator of Ras-like GTPase activity (Roadblock/LC7/MglB family)
MKTIINLIIILMVSTTLNYSQNSIKFDKPILISSAGQSADVTLAGMLFKKSNIEYKANPMAKEVDLDGIKTLVIVPGFSSKGLGAAGISRDTEKSRVSALIASAKKKNIKILVMHLGGTARRGQQSDDFNEMAAEAANSMIVVKQGNEDGFFTKISSDKKINLKLIDKMADAVVSIKELF